MPIDFPDAESVKRAGEVWDFRPQKDNESDELYRGLVSLHCRDKDSIESFEIFFGVGCDKWTPLSRKHSLSECNYANQN